MSAQELLELARQYEQLAHAAKDNAIALGARDAPMSLCDDALELARAALRLATSCERIARQAMSLPIPERD